MKAAVYKGNSRLAVEEVPTPSPAANEVLIKVKYSAICGTDVHAVMYDAAPVGVVLGHEYCGTIAEIGSDVTRWKLGDRVIGGGGAPPPGKGKPWSTQPRFNYRTEGMTQRRLSGYAEFIVLEEWQPVAIPDGVPDESAAVCEPCSVAVKAVRTSNLRLGDTVAILGAGPIGLFAIQAARAAGALQIMVSEPSETRRVAAEALGADLVIDPNRTNPIAAIEDMTDGLGAHIVFDCAGLKNTLDQAASMARRGGQAVLIAVPWEPLPVAAADWMAREINIQTTFGAAPEDWRTSLKLMQAGSVRVESMLKESDFVALEEIDAVFRSLFKPTDRLQVIVKL